MIINYKTHEATSIFIRNNLSNISPPKLYDLDQEFANTQKNKNSITIISLVLFILLFLAAAFGVTKYIEYQNSQIPININAFEDVNLREIFDKAKQYEKDMKKASRDLEDLYLQRDSAIYNLKNITEDKINLIETENPSNKNIRIRTLNNELDESIKKENINWNNLIDIAKDKIKVIQDKIDSYDTRIIEKAKEQEDIINNQQKRFDMELEASVKYYEDKISIQQEQYSNEIKNIEDTNNEIIKVLKNNNKNQIEALINKNESQIKTLESKYNPLFKNDYSYINDAIESEISKVDTSQELSIKNLVSEGLLRNTDIIRNVKDYNNVNSVLDRLGEIPYYNSPLSAINFIESKYNSTIVDFVKFISNSEQNILEKNIIIKNKSKELSQFEYLILDYLKTNKINGIIIDPRGSDIKLFTDPIYQIRMGAKGYIYRNDSDYIGTIRFRQVNNVLIGNIEELANKENGLKPFDKILINLK